MGDKQQPDFSGWATKSDLVCSDGRTIKPGAFKHQDKKTVPLVWMHQHSDAENILGHAVLENRAFGVYTYGFFNETKNGKHMKAAVQHGDIVSLSIYANNLTERATPNGKEVYHGDIKEVSLVTAGANPGAFIENVNMVHGDDVTTINEAVIYTGLALEHSDMPKKEKKMGKKKDAETDEQNQEVLEHADVTKQTIKDVFDGFTDVQKNVVYFMLGDAVERTKQEAGAAQHSEIMNSEEFLAHVNNTIKEGIAEMTTHNLFEQQGDVKSSGAALTHDQFAELMKDAKKLGTFKESFLAHAATYGIDDIETLFPDAKQLPGGPELYSRRMGWVDKVLSGTKHSPFAKVKSIVFDITEEEARAKGYIKGNQKKDEVIKLMKRTTGPTTIYKKQKLDRDDVIDITDMDVVAWLKAEIRLMLEEEIARAILFGDGRSALSDDKVKDPEGANSGDGIRSILHDADFYAIKTDLAANVAPKDAVKGIIRARSSYRGTGKPDLFISDAFLTDIMLEEDKFGRPLYETEQVLADKLRVNEIVTVDIIDDTENLFAIMVNLADYTVGTNKGGELTSFEDFDIDFNQQKYLMETRLSGALTKPFSAVVIRRLQGTLATATAPSFNGATNTITIPTSTGVVYLIDGNVVTGDVVITQDTEVTAEATTGYYLAAGTVRDWTFTYSPA